MSALPVGTRIRKRRPPFYLGRYGQIVSFISGRTYDVIMDGGHTWLEREEFSVTRDFTLGMFEPMRERLPYGVWDTKDGRSLLFNRDYQIIWERDGLTAWGIIHDKMERLDLKAQGWFFDDRSQPWNDERVHWRVCEARRAFIANESVIPFLVGGALTLP